MKQPTKKFTRNGTQRFEATFEIDLESKEETEGQEVVIPSLCGTKGAVWKMYWYIRTDGRLWAGVRWDGSVIGAVTGWTTCEMGIKCSALSSRSLLGYSFPVKDKLPPVYRTTGRVLDMKKWQGKGHGTQEITVSLEISFGSPPTSIAPGYTDCITTSTPSNVKFSFPHNRSLFGNVDSLSKASPYYKTLFESGFAEGSLSTLEQGAAKSNRRVVEREFDDSDDEAEEDIMPEATPIPSTASDTPAAATVPSSDTLTKPDPSFRLVNIDAAAYTTYHAVLCYLQTGHITFAPLRSSFRLQPDSTTLRNAKIAELHFDHSHPLPASPKSVYRLAHFLELCKLADLALVNIKSQLTPENIAFEVFGDGVVPYDDLSDLLLDYAAQNWNKAKESLAMAEVNSCIARGEGVSVYAIMSSKLLPMLSA